MNELQVYLTQVGQGGIFLIIGFAVFVIGKYLRDFFEPKPMDYELTTRDNFAVAISMVGYYIGITIVFLSVIASPGKDLLWDIINVSVYSLLGLLLLNISYSINDRIILVKTDADVETYDKMNSAVGIAVFGSYIASSLFIAMALFGETKSKIMVGYFPVSADPRILSILEGIIVTIVFFLLGQIALILFSYYYKMITSYDLETELCEKKNVAAGISFGGAQIAIGIVVARALHKDFISWEQTALLLGLDFLLTLVMFPLLRLFTDKIILKGSPLVKEIAVDQNAGAGILEACVLICFSGILFFTL